MSNPTRLLALATLTAAALFTGCVKQVETITPPPPPAPAPEPFSTAATVAPTQGPNVAGIPAAAIAAAERAKARVEVAATHTADNGTLYNQAKTFFAEKKYPEALRALDSIQAELMTPAQDKAVATLRTQIAQAQTPTR